MLTLGEIKGVGEATLKKLKELDIGNVFELFSFLPSKYLDLSEPTSVEYAAAGQTVLLEGQVVSVSSVSPRGRRGFSVSFKDMRSDKRIYFKATFFNLPYLHDSFKVGDCFRLLTKLSKDTGELSVVNPQTERLDKLSKLSSGVYTIYPLKGVMGQNAFKNIIYAALDSVNGAKYGGAMGAVNEDIARCFEKLHRPSSIEEAQEALSRLASIDVAIALSIYKKLSKSTVGTRKVFYDSQKIRILDFENALPFMLTESQRQAMDDIQRSLESKECMSRIISGDVGSGKTAVAFFAMYAAAYGGHQAALMAPTEILAIQHARAFAPVADKLGIKFALLTSSTPQRLREDVLFGLKSGEISCVIGTQSLIGEGVKYADLALVIIDEQHKFGVNERKMLENKGAVDILSMTATPIPRSMALTFYEDIDISYIKKRAEAETNITTRIVQDVTDALQPIIEACRAGKQAFIVCPAISDAEGFELASIESFIKQYGGCFDGLKTSVLHGKLSNEEKQAAMRAFAAGETSVLVATTVVEVGIDTRASEILILCADRFGLASLHQLRGRVGRDGAPANCYLQTSSTSEKALTRLGAMEKSCDGQYLAEVDFETRGGGDFIGTRQSGIELSPLFGLRINSRALKEAKAYSDTTLKNLSLAELLALTRRGESRVREFVDNIKKVTLNS